MQQKKMQYTEHLVGRDLTREELIEKFPQMKTLPIIVDDGRLIGGYTNLVEKYNGAK
jgi:glutaredoxin